MSMLEKRCTLQLARLVRVMDVVFAIVIWRLFMQGLSIQTAMERAGFH